MIGAELCKRNEQTSFFEALNGAELLCILEAIRVISASLEAVGWNMKCVFCLIIWVMDILL